MDYASLEPRSINNSHIKTKLSESILLDTNNPNTNDENAASASATTTALDEFKLRRIMHRDIERQRRQEMSTLYSSLRSLLPLKYVKGKRSISDHMHEAVKYIKDKEANIKEMEKRRDSRIKPKPNVSWTGTGENGSCSSSSVTVNPWQNGGIEILISVNCKGQNFPISRVLREIILNQGFDVISCVNSRSLYTIHAEACGMKCIDHQAVQQKLIDIINLDL